MAHQQLRRRGTESAHQSYTLGTGEITYVTDNKLLAIGDSSQLGGFIVPKLTANKRTLDANGVLYANSTTTLTTSTAFTWDATTLTVDGNISLVGAQTISTSAGILTVTGTGGLTLSTAANTNILISPNGTGDVNIASDLIFVDQSAGSINIGTTGQTDRFYVLGLDNQWSIFVQGTSTSDASFGLRVDAGTSASDTNFQLRSAAAGVFATMTGAGLFCLGTATPLSKLHISGASGWIIQDEQDTDPTTTQLDSADSIAIYNKSDKFVIAYNNAGTITYLTIPLDASTTTWTQSTVAP